MTSAFHVCMNAASNILCCGVLMRFPLPHRGGRGGDQLALDIDGIALNAGFANK
ncbi:hypothetical protein D3C72_1046100 [compost metagenome]